LRTGDFTHVVDIGSGSGIIGISVGDLVEKVIFLDISGAALSVTKENFLRYFPEEK
jgi:methylase of polypeptide subunit release factors